MSVARERFREFRSFRTQRREFSPFWRFVGVVTTAGLPEYKHAIETRSILPEDLFDGPVKVHA